MGSFDVACVISDLSIGYGDKVGFMLIEDSAVLNDYKARNLVPEPGWIHYGLEDEGYKPFLPPVFGEYNDYGYVTNVEETETSRFIENLFGKPIETVIKCVGSNRDIYSSHSEIFESYFVGDKTFSNYDANTKESLTALGFIHSATKDGRDAFAFGRYSLVSLDDKGDKYSILDVERERTVLESFYARGLTELLSIFGHYTNLYPGFESEHYWAIRKLHRLSGTFFLKEIYTQMSTSKRVIERFRVNRFEKLKEEWPEFKAYVLDPANEEKVRFISDLDYKFDTAQYLIRDTAFNREKMTSLVAFEDPAELWRMIEIRNILTSVNKVLLPNHCGEQHGNDKASDYLAQISRKFLKKRKEESDY